MPNTENQFERKSRIAPSTLVGQRLWACGRIGGMAMFNFGSRLTVPNRSGGTKQVGEYALHVQCGWRITRGKEVVVGSRDLYCPADLDEQTDIPDDFDWDKESSRREKQFSLLFENGTRDFLVEAVENGPVGKLTLFLSNEAALEIFPDHSLNSEYWRLFQTGSDEAHFVMGPDGGRAQTF